VTGLYVLEELGGPHLVLSNLGNDKEVGRKDRLQGLENLLAASTFAVHTDGVPLLVPGDLFHPILVQHRLFNPFVQMLPHHLHVSHHMAVGLDVLVDFSRIDIDVDDLGILGKNCLPC
jgi:hypothetical protein